MHFQFHVSLPLPWVRLACQRILLKFLLSSPHYLMDFFQALAPFLDQTADAVVLVLVSPEKVLCCPDPVSDLSRCCTHVSSCSTFRHTIVHPPVYKMSNSWLRPTSCPFLKDRGTVPISLPQPPSISLCVLRSVVFAALPPKYEGFHSVKKRKGFKQRYLTFQRWQVLSPKKPANLRWFLGSTILV